MPPRRVGRNSSSSRGRGTTRRITTGISSGRSTTDRSSTARTSRASTRRATTNRSSTSSEPGNRGSSASRSRSPPSARIDAPTTGAPSSGTAGRPAFQPGVSFPRLPPLEIIRLAAAATVLAVESVNLDNLLGFLREPVSQWEAMSQEDRVMFVAQGAAEQHSTPGVEVVLRDSVQVLTDIARSMRDILDLWDEQSDEEKARMTAELREELVRATTAIFNIFDPLVRGHSPEFNNCVQSRSTMNN